MTRYEAYIDKTWREHGLAYVIVVRKRENGLADYGMFSVDLWCLGVKDAWTGCDLPQAELDNFIQSQLSESVREAIHPACAKKLIEGTVAYAEGLGFAPHREFRKARRVLSGLDTSVCPMEFNYGRDGRPCYVRAESDSEERVDRVLAILEARLGQDGFDFEDFEEDDDEISTLRDHLKAWLDAEPPNVPRFYAVSGMMTALHICPGLVSPMQLMEELWGEEGRVWANDEELRKFTSLFTNYWNYIGDLVFAAAASDATPEDQPIDLWADELPGDDPLPMMAAMVEWALGFLRTTELWPDAWKDALDRPDLAPHWEVVRWWADFVDEENRDRITNAAESTPSRTMTKSIVALSRALRPQSGNS
jgi:yecA family protein